MRKPNKHLEVLERKATIYSGIPERKPTSHRSMSVFRLISWSLCVLVVVVLTGCISPEETASGSPKGKLLKEAGEFASDLKAHDKLPGYSSNEHGRLITSAAWKGGHVSYPATVTVRAWKEGDDTTYCYALVKDNPESNWQLTKVTHLDKSDQVIEQFVPK